MTTSILSIIMLTLVGLMPAPAPQKKVIYPPGAKAGGNFSPGISIDGSLYVSGMLGLDANGKIPETFEAEVQQSLDNIDAVLKAGGMSRDDVVSVQVYLTDLETFQRMNKVYAAHFKDPRPTRTTVVVAGLVNGGHIEITVTARK
jgi:2-iminobutanoate/2-iminopropanoate deaminase